MIPRSGLRGREAHLPVLNLFLTVDTEFWPRRAYLGPDDYRSDFERDVLGATPQGEFGLRYQLATLNEYGLRAVFHVESLCAEAVGPEPVREMVGLVRDAGHDVQLHAHTEWLDRAVRPPVPERRGLHIRQFSKADQTALIATAAATIRRCGAEGVNAFRAGNYGANLDTLRALAHNGIAYDTSYNPAYLDSACDMRTEKCLTRPQSWLGVAEFPITVFREFTGRLRHLQLTACSSREIETVLDEAWEQGWPAVVLVLHSFELIRRFGRHGQAEVDRIAVRRFGRLCWHLAENRQKFRTMTFSETPEFDRTDQVNPLPLRVGIIDTSLRYFEQAVRRIAPLF